MTLQIDLELGSHRDNDRPGVSRKSTKWSGSPLLTISSLNPAMLSQTEGHAYTTIDYGFDRLMAEFLHSKYDSSC
jgi:hypothetical protein